MGQKRLISDLVGPYEGKPILVICGGVSVLEALENIPADYPACVISANGHGFKQDKFKVDFIAHVDILFSRTQTPMQKHFEPFKTPTISRWSFADYRIPNFGYAGDTGQSSVLIAAMLGAWPVVVAGLDRNRGVRRYFHESMPENGWARRKIPNLSPNLNVNANRMQDVMRERCVRIMPSMRDLWPNWRVWDLNEKLLPYVPPTHKDLVGPREDKGAEYIVQKQLFLHPSDPISGGRVMLSDNEALQHLRTGRLKKA